MLIFPIWLLLILIYPLYNNVSKVPKELLKGKISIKDYEDGEIIQDPFGVVFNGKGKNGIKKKFLLRIDDVERYSNSHHSSILLRNNNC